MSDPSQQGQPSQEEMQAYIEQLRAADPSEIVAQAFTMLGTGAELKLGRPDARVLIDAVAALVGAVGDRVSDELRSGMESGLAQLQQAQVEAEQQAGGAAGEPEGSEPTAQAPPSSPPPSQSPGQGSQGSDRLWVPGRD
ncbi:MAG: hypothetical protein ACQETV_05185 [Actinomycetota bacterium]